MNFGFGGIWMIVIWIVIIAAIVFAIRGLTGSSRGEDRHAESPLEVLKRRYAAGDISQAEFETKKHDLISS